MTKDTKYVVLLSSLYFVVSLFGIMHHELWLDESHHWLMARDSNSLGELFEVTRPDGHPILWNVLLYIITRFTFNLFWMQLLHIVISTLTVYIFLRKAPFNWIFKTLFIFGYFMIFEYNLISRNYILGVFFLFLACSVFEKRKEKFVLLSVCLALAANIHLMFSMIAFALMLAILFENYQNKLLFQRQYLIGYAIFGIGILTLGIQLQTSNAGWFFNMLGDIPLTEKINKGFVALFKGVVAIPDFRSIHFWNSNFIVNINRPLATVLALLIYLVPVLLFFKNKKTLFFVYTALIGTQIFFFITQRAATRFHGMTYIIIIMALWIEQYYTSDSYKLKTILNRFKVALLQKPIIFGMLIVHFIAGITAYTLDCIYPFTAAKETVDFIKKEKLNGLPVISLTCDGTSISPYLEKKVWFLCDGGYQSYCHWDFPCAININEAGVQKLISGFMVDHTHALYVSYFSPLQNPKRNVWIALNPEVKIRLLEKFDNEYILKENDYYVYEVAKNLITTTR